MRQTLFYVPENLFGFPVFGFGLIFWGILIATVVAIVLRVRKHGFDKECVGYLPMFFFAEAIVALVFPLVAQEGKGFPIRGYGFFLLLGISSAAALLIHRAKKLWNIPPDTVISLALWGVVSGLIGARLFFVIEYRHEFIRDDFMSTLIALVSITEGGLVVYGSIIFGILGTIAFMVKNKLPVLATFDLIAPAVLLGLAFGRLGCLMNGCCFGGPSELPWAVTFPGGSPAHLHQIQHDQSYFAGLKFVDEDRSADERFHEPVALDASDDVARVLEKYAQDKRSRVLIEEVQAGSDAEKAGLKPGMRVLAVGSSQTPHDHAHDHGDTEKTSEKNAAKPSLGVSLVKDRIGVLYYINDVFKEHRSEIFLAVADANAGADTTTVNSGETPQAFRLVRLPLEPSDVRPVHPTQIYSAMCAALGCVALLACSRFCKKDGQVFLLFLFGYSVTRFMIEQIRTDEDSFFGTGLTISQNVSVCVFGAAICLAMFIAKQRPGKRAYDGMFPNETTSGSGRRNS